MSLTQQYKEKKKEISEIMKEVYTKPLAIPCAFTRIDSGQGFNIKVTGTVYTGDNISTYARLKKGYYPLFLAERPIEYLKFNGTYKVVSVPVVFNEKLQNSQLCNRLYSFIYGTDYDKISEAGVFKYYIITCNVIRDGYNLWSCLRYLYESTYSYIANGNPITTLLSLTGYDIPMPRGYHRLSLPRSRQLIYLQDLLLKPAEIGLVKTFSKIDYVSSIDFALFAAQSPLHKYFVKLWASLGSNLNRTELYEMIKTQTVRLKIINNYFACTGMLIEAEVLLNRDETSDEVDWHAEYRLRTSRVVNDISYQQVYDYAMTLFKQNPHPYHAKSLDDYIATCAIESPAGAFYAENLPFFKKEVRKKFKKGTIPTQKLGSKTFCLPFLKPQTIKRRLLNLSTMYAQTHVKYEQGKQRALYATDVFSQLACDFVLPKSELFLPRQCLVGAPSQEEEVASLFKHYNLPFVYAFGTDYAGFNEQHKQSSLIAVLQAAYDFYCDKMSDDQRVVFKNVIQSRQHMKVKFRQISKTAFVPDTLMSGERWTTFLNSMLNCIYYMHVNHGQQINSYHNGDDAIAFTNTDQTYYTMLDEARRKNIIIKKHKCYFGASSEFLRKQMFYNCSRSYLPRAIASMTYMKIESLEPIDKVERLKAYTQRIVNYIDCGGNVAKLNIRNIHKYIGCKVDTHDLWTVDEQHGGALPILSEAGQVLATHLRVVLNLHQCPANIFVVKDKIIERELEKVIVKAPLVRKAMQYLLDSPNLDQRGKRIIKSLILMRFIQDQKTISYHVEQRKHTLTAEELRELKKAVFGVEIPYTKWDKTAQLLKMASSRQRRTAYISKLLSNIMWLTRLENMNVTRRV